MNAFELEQEQKLRDAIARTNGDSLWAYMFVIREILKTSDASEATLRRIAQTVASCARVMDHYALARGLDDSQRSKEQVERVRNL